jgi:hypothetical protein
MCPDCPFGLHLVNMSGRPFGKLDNVDVERYFSSKVAAAYKARQYDSFLDFATVLYAASLDAFITKFEKDAVPFVMIQWRDDQQHQWYSLLVQISSSQLILELVSAAAPESPTARAAMIDDPLQRLQASVFAANNVSMASPHRLIPLAISKACSNISAATKFYVDELGATVQASSTSPAGVTMKMFGLPGANMVVRYVQRPSSATTGPFTIAMLESAKLEAHKMAHTSVFCGVDKWYDNHFAYDQNITYLDAFKERFDARGRIYHIFGDCKPSSVPGPGTNIYVVDTIGDAVQLDGSWVHCPSGGSGDALQNPCSQGNCTSHVASASCRKELKAACPLPSPRGLTSICTDCAYRQWVQLEQAGCTNADIANHCTANNSTKHSGWPWIP